MFVIFDVSQVDEDSETDLGEFMLQYACGTVEATKKLVYHTAYQGQANSHTIKNLRTNTTYTIRVRGRVDKLSPWQAWSLPHAASTSLHHHCKSASIFFILCFSGQVY